MNQKEEAQLKRIEDLMIGIQKSQIEYRQLVDKQLLEMNMKVEKKHLPVYLETDITTIAQQSIQAAIKEVLTKYDSPLVKLTKQVVDAYSAELYTLIDQSFGQVIKTQTFKDSIVAAFSHKVARTIISNNEGLFDKVSNQLKQDQVFRAKMTVAVSNVVEECLKK